MKDEIKQHIKNISIAAISTLPIAGGPVSVLLDKYVPEYIDRRRDNLVEQINKDLIVLQSRFDNLDFSNERFISTFMKCTKLSLEEHEILKIEAYKNIILNSVLPSEL